MKTLFVLGAGTMGSGIAEIGLTAGMKVYLCDTIAVQLERASARISKDLDKRVAKGHMTQLERDAAFANLTVTDQMQTAAEADYVVEAILENLDAKKSVFTQLSEICQPDALLASNTSTISITAISAVVKNPGRLIGMHFFNPVPAMKLLELIRGLQTDDATVAAAQEFATLTGKTPIVSKDSAGFIANRIGSPMLNAAVNVYDAGTGSAEDVDKAMKLGWGFPMGPLELIDMVGVDVQVAVMEVLYQETGDSYYKPAPLLKRMMAAGLLGRKTGRGFYDYTK
ncbi:MAG: 3-hydroxyacyl-CoA dehydrogenase NAD-binding domain-containing protein [Oscillospiraceae bacterium]|nr:3-hydroxyacyl-CoA dehydrogenase NAD-binding domain-containing protein [Oscillospiraceae bacterium]